MKGITINNFLPSYPLRQYIKTYYLLEADMEEATRDVFFADGCPEIVFNWGLDFYRGNEKESWAKAIGQIVDPLEVKARGRGKSFGIWFQPHGLAMFTKIPLSEITNRAIALEEIFSRDLVEFVGECLAASQIQVLINFLNTYFETKARSESNNPQADIAIMAVDKLSASNRRVSLKDLADDCNISHRYLQKVFLRRIGLTPGQFQRVSRFQNALTRLHNEGNDLTRIAYSSGYFDQSHFIREFKRFASMVPSKYRAGNHPVHRHFFE